MTNLSINTTNSEWEPEGVIEGRTWFPVLAIVVLLGIGSYEYSDVMLVVNRNDGREILMNVAKRQQEYFKKHQKYSSELGDLGYEKVENLSVASAKGLYRVVITAADSVSFELAAEPQDDQNGDNKCSTLTYNSRGNAKSAKGSAGTGCW